MGTTRRRELQVWTGRPPDRAERRRRRRTVERIAEDARRLTGVYEAECLASALLGRLWERRGQTPVPEGIDPRG